MRLVGGLHGKSLREERARESTENGAAPLPTTTTTIQYLHSLHTGCRIPVIAKSITRHMQGDTEFRILVITKSIIQRRSRSSCFELSLGFRQASIRVFLQSVFSCQILAGACQHWRRRAKSYLYPGLNPQPPDRQSHTLLTELGRILLEMSEVSFLLFHASLHKLDFVYF